VAGPREANYVSIPLGPGVLSNTTGRGAKTRLNYMNWDRWQDANWVRWHKLLPEKQGGWAFQALLAANVLPQLVPGSPALLLHFNFALLPFSASLLLHMDGTNGSKSFPDSSTFANVVTATGAAALTTSNPKFGSASLGGTTFGSYVSTPAAVNGPLDLGTGDFTVEVWVFPTATNPSQNQTIICTGNGFSGGFLIADAAGDTLSVVYGGGANFAHTTHFSIGVWNAIAFVRKAGVQCLFLNGIAGPTQTNPVTLSPPAAQLAIGYNPVGGGPGFNGQIDEVRITKGVALYTGNYTPSAIALLPTGLALQPSYLDSSLYNWPMTANATAGLDAGNPKFGTGALISDGVAALVSTPIGLGTPLDLSAGDFTLEFWMRSTAAAASVILDASNGHTGGLYISQLGSAAIQANIWNGASYSTISAAVPLNAYEAIALVRAGAVFTLYAGGVAAGTVTIPGNIGPVGGNLGIGGGFTTSFTGDIDEVRLTLEALYTTNYTPATVENTLGLPNILGVPNTPNAFSPATYLGLARDIKDWSSIDGQYWIAIGTHLKLYVVNQATLYDITPQRKTSNLVNALTTVNGSPIVTIVDPGHQAGTGDFVDVTGAASVGGITLAGSYPITVLDPSSYTVTASIAAISAVTGGGNFSVSYEIGIGLPNNGELLGYGTGVYGAGTYGTPRQPGQGVFARLRTWSLDNFGQDLIASQSDGEMYIWQKNSGPNSRAVILPNAPQGVQRVIVDANSRVIIALGCTDVTSAFNAVLVRWCSFNDITDWFPTDVNTAGDDFLPSGSRIITGLKTKGQNLIWTDTTLYRMVFVGAPDIYDFVPAGEVTIVGPNAAVDVDGVAYFMGFENIYNYSGTLNLQACDVWETVFDPTQSTSLLKTQAEKVACYTYEAKTEITWLYPSIGGSGENDRYVTFNWEDGVWYCGAWNRTCASGRAPAMGGFPYGVNAGLLYQHEVGTDAIEPSGTVAIAYFMRSLDITVGGAKGEFTMGGSDARFAIGGSDAHLLVRSILPDFKYLTGQMNLTLFTKDRPQQASYTQNGPVTFDATAEEIDIDAHGSQIVIQMDNLTGPGGVASLGCSFRMGIFQGLATPYAKR
jgi:hypothetical protein